MPTTEQLTLLTERFIKAMNTYDAGLLAACFAADADFINVQGRKINGRAEIQKAHEPLFAVHRVPGVPSFYNSVFEAQSAAIRIIKDGVVNIDIVWSQTGTTAPDGEPWPTRNGLINAVAVEENGEWLFVAFYNRII